MTTPTVGRRRRRRRRSGRARADRPGPWPVCLHASERPAEAAPAAGFATDVPAELSAAGAETVTVRLSASTDRDVSVPLEWQRPSGEAFVPVGTLTIPAGAMSASVVLLMMDDPFAEKSGWVVVRLGSPTNATRSDRADLPAEVRVRVRPADLVSPLDFLVPFRPKLGLNG
jgi:hypothetical protein